MKSALLIFSLCASTVFAQVGNRVSLELGTVTVWLGMDKAAVKQQVEASGMNFDQSNPNIVLVADVQAKRVFTLKFEHDKLVYADRNWLSDEAKALPSVMDALTALIDKGATSCTITDVPVSSPDTKMNRVFINCGNRGILLTYGTQNVAGQSFSNNAISESIGTFQ
jgi:hypothetical protein